VRNALPVCPTYLSRQSKYFIWQIPLPLYFVVGTESLFCIVFFIMNAVLICVSFNNFDIFLFSLPLSVNVVHFGFCELGVRASIPVFSFRFCGVGCFITFSYYICCYLVCFYNF
jgi:hypothetical protein